MHDLVGNQSAVGGLTSPIFATLLSSRYKPCRLTATLTGINHIMGWVSFANGTFIQLVLPLLAVGVRTDNPFEVPVYNDLAYQRFNISLSIGTPPRPYNVLLDSGATSAWVPVVNTTGCTPNCPWAYDPTSSSTIVKTNDTLFSRYGTTGEIEVKGFYYRDSVSVGGLPALKNATFAIADFPKAFYDQGNRGIMGMGCRLIEFDEQGRPRPLSYTPIWQSLSRAASAGKTKFSMWLNSPNAASGTIQFGGEDRSKHQGELLSIPLNEDPPGVVADWNITLGGIARGFASRHGHLKSELITPPSFNRPMILDSGAPNLYIATSVYEAIAEGLNATEITYEAPWVPCSLKKPETGYLEFQFATRKAKQLVKIRVPYEDLIYPSGFPVTVPRVPDQNGEKMCYFGVVPSDGFVQLLGAPFLRRTYTVFDVDNKELRMAPANWKLDI